jgi:hypothetical protein
VHGEKFKDYGIRYKVEGSKAEGKREKEKGKNLSSGSQISEVQSSIF